MCSSEKRMVECFCESDFEALTMNPALGEAGRGRMWQGEGSMSYPMVVKDDVFLESSCLCYDELTQLRESTQLLKPAQMGQGYEENRWQNKLFRGLNLYLPPLPSPSPHHLR